MSVCLIIRAEELLAAVATCPPEDELPAPTSLATPSMLELRRKDCVGFNDEARWLTVELPKDAWCDNVPGRSDGAKWTGAVWYENGFGNVAWAGICLLVDDTDELPALACLAKPSMSRLVREARVCVNDEVWSLTMKLLADGCCDRALG